MEESIRMKKTKSKYLNIYDYENPKYPFQVFIGGRGCGKTYSALTGAVEKHQKEGKKFVFMRRTGQELELLMDMQSKEGFNPFKPINAALGTNIGIKQLRKDIGGIYQRTYGNVGTKDAGKLMYEENYGYAVAVTTIKNIRGIDFSDCDLIIYDEFIPEKHVHKITGEGIALLNAYETMNRNRELEGKPAMAMYLLANSNDIYNEIFKELHLVNIAERMQAKGEQDKYFHDRGLAIHIIKDNEEFREEKSNTALYKLSKGTNFYDMSLNNEFAFNDFSLTGYRNLKGYQPICAFGEAYIYKHKGKDEMYVSYAPAKVEKYNPDHDYEKRMFLQKFMEPLCKYYVAGAIMFESYELKSLILDAIIL